MVNERQVKSHPLSILLWLRSLLRPKGLRHLKLRRNEGTSQHWSPLRFRQDTLSCPAGKYQGTITEVPWPRLEIDHRLLADRRNPRRMRMKPMDKRFLTFLVFPGAHGQLRRIHLPFYVMHLVLAFSIVGFMTVAALANSYARMLLKVANYNSMATEREALKSQVKTLEGAVIQTNAELGSLGSLAKEVALTYGFGQTHPVQFPQAVLALATQSNSTLGSSYRASLYAFNLIRRSTMDPAIGGVGYGMFPNPGMEQQMVPSLWPVRGPVTAGFGQRLDPFSGEGAFHRGVDIGSPFGTGVEASADGIILQAGPDFGYGNEILIDHGFGMATKYGHLSKIFVVMGQEVKRGQVIGAVGMTGKTTGPHLHYEVRVHQTPVNPAKYLRD